MDHPISPNTEDLQGKLLLADPSMRDGNFYKSVILLAEHDSKEGAFGLVLNHPTGKKVGELLPAAEFAPLSKIGVFAGGPVGRDHLTFAAMWAEGKNLKFTTRMSAEQAIKFTSKPGAIVHAFIGYSGWGKDQLEGELENEAWHPIPVAMTLLQHPHDLTLWSKTLQGISPFHHILSLTPENILAN